MNLFVFACLGLVLLGALFCLLPFRRRAVDEEDLQRANVEWFRVRQQELAAESDEALQEDAALRLLEDEQGSTAEISVDSDMSGFPRWVLPPLIGVCAALLYYVLGAAPDVLISRQLESWDKNTSPADREQVMQAIEERLAQRPGNIDYTAMLARHYMGKQDFSKAAQIYDELTRQLPGQAQPLAYAAQAQYLATGRKLTAAARVKAEQALAINPHESTALGLLGMVAYEQGQYREAIDYWQRLLAVESPDSGTARMIASVVASAKEKLGEDPGADVAASAKQSGEVAAAATTGAGVTVQVKLPADAHIGATDTVFVLARDPASGSRMPIAVQKFRGDQLPLTVRLDDRNSMAGQKLSGAASIVVVVQVSPSGRPGEASATWLGQGGPLAPSDDDTALQIELHRKRS